jgi:zinc/manganese transport system substrate-binding protein
MKSILCCFLFFLAVVKSEAKIQVVTTTTDLAAIVKAVGGDWVDVDAIAKGYQDPHYVQAKPSYMRLMNHADLLVYVGLDLEVGWLALLIQGARNPQIVSGATGHLDASAGIRRLDVPQGTVDRSMGDVHPQGNPHYWLDPRNGIVIAKAIVEKLVVLDPQHAEVFQSRLTHFETDLTAQIMVWEKQLAHFKGRKVVTYHKTWGYLADWLQFQIVAQVENKPGIPPSPRHVSDLVSRMQADGIGVMLCANLVDTKVAQRVAERSRAKLVVLPASVGGEKGVDTYRDLFAVIVARLGTVNEGL